MLSTILLDHQMCHFVYKTNAFSLCLEKCWYFISFTMPVASPQQELSLGSPSLELSKPCKYMHLSVYASCAIAWFIHGWFALMLVCIDDLLALMIGLHWWLVCIYDGFALMIGLHWWLVCINDWFALMIGLHWWEEGRRRKVWAVRKNENPHLEVVGKNGPGDACGMPRKPPNHSKKK